ncbi:MAG: DUF1071 domain-containing protein [Leptolyngbyaceae cyanobacterium SL_7_1]|nr:DUF1071 domain-containing protein [Leptolyngbyaceae cyanobacterium SL_7_1]
MQTTERLTPPTQPGEWSLDQIIADLSRPLPKSVLDIKKRGGNNIPYLPWYEASKILDKYAPGWTWEIRSLHTTTDRLFIVGRLTIPTSNGNLYREATGTEVLKEDKEVWIGEKPNRQLLKDEFNRPITEPKELAYGDLSSNAESMAFRRAAARFGLGLYLYDKD